jgi:multisubunit Na+/H+ antiporter MnhG subunit
MYLVENERWKLTAAWLNTMAAGTVIAGAVTPLVALAYGLRADTEPLATGLVVLLTFIWISAGIGLHFTARAILGRLRE